MHEVTMSQIRGHEFEGYGGGVIWECFEEEKIERDVIILQSQK